MYRTRSQVKRYILLCKPYGVLSQFTSKEHQPTLKDLGTFPPDVYPAGRLDFDSEGLLLLTNDPQISHILTDPRYEHEKTYVVQVEGIPTDDALARLQSGVILQGKKTLPAHTRRLPTPPIFPPRPVPIRQRKEIPTSWIEIRIREGRNRQVRKMTAAVGFPTLRLIRTGIAHLRLGSLQPGKHRDLTDLEIQGFNRALKKRAKRSPGSP